MPTPEEQGTVYGNLHAYKMYTRPMAQRLYGSFSFRKKSGPIHHEKIQKLLKILALNGALTTWAMAKTHIFDTKNIRTQEKDYRRLLVGRIARGKSLPGLLEIGLVVKDGKSTLRGLADQYRLSLHGVLYCIDTLDMTNKEIDIMTEKYSKILPKVFGKWQDLKSNIGNEVYRLKNLAGGLFMDNIQIAKISNFPVYELMTFLNVKYQNNFEQITEEEFANQISIWFYTNLLVPAKFRSSGKHSSLEMRKWKKIIQEDSNIKKWYYNFVDEAIKFYSSRFNKLKKLENM